eukprot:jgi/Mesvir1/13995/Mv02850-RA.3
MVFQKRMACWTVCATALLSAIWLGIAAAQTEPNVAVSCPCWDPAFASFSFVMHYYDPTVSAGAFLRSGVHQAAQDHSFKLREYNPIQVSNVTNVVQFIDAEVQAGTSGIVTTLYGEQIMSPLRAAHRAGVPIYIVGGADPSLVERLRNETGSWGPAVHTSIRYIGQDVDELARMLARQLIAAGVYHVGCLITDVGTLLWFRLCRVLIDEMEAAGRAGMWHIRSDSRADLAIYVEGLENANADTPAANIAVVVMDSHVYGNIKDRLRQGTKGGSLLVVYETSVQVLQDIRNGDRVIAIDPGYYSQGYMAMSLAAAELQTGQMVTSDITTNPAFYGGTGENSLPVTDEVIRREVCRAEGNPVCGYPGVVPVTPSGCHCFNRSTVRYKVISGLPKSFACTHQLWQGMKDVERAMAGTTFDWTLYDAVSFSEVGDYNIVVNSSRYVGAICLDGMVSDVIPGLKAAIQSISQAGKPLYLAYGKSTPTDTMAFLGEYGARAYVGGSPYESGLYIGQLAVSAGRRHLLANNIAPIIPWTWHLMHGIVSGVVGEDYVFPPNIWEWPVTDHGSRDSRTGAWALFVDQDTNRTAQVMDGLLPSLGEAFLPPLAQRLTSDVPAPDVVAIEASIDLMATGTLALFSDLARDRPARKPVVLITEECSTMEYLALARQGKVKGEELLLGCVDQQCYLSTYLSAILAALEQQTGESIVGGVDTARLIKASHLPPGFMRHMHCELDGYNRGIAKNQLGMFYPVCDMRNGCLPGGLDAPRGAEACSGHGSCHFPTEADPSGGTNMLQGACQCEPGWEGRYCQVATLSPSNDQRGRTYRVILAVLLSMGLALLLLGAAILLAVWRMRKGTDAKELHEFLRKRAPPRRGDDIAAVVTDIEALTSLWEWNPEVMNEALTIHLKVAERLPPVHLMEVLPQELVRRAPFRPLNSKQLRPSFFDAPCASECYLKAEPPKQPVVICFMYVGGASNLRRTPGYQPSITLLVGFVQSRLTQYEAYECEEKDGNFLLAFRSPIQAARFAEVVQREAMDLDWPEHLLEQEAAAEVVKLAESVGGSTSHEERIVFRGLRLQIGLCMGIPNDCRPHMATGRAAYFGPVVNRAARIAATAAPGQTLANQDVFEGAKGQTQGITFQELGEYGLKGIKELLRLYQVSSEPLSLRLFPRTLKLARTLAPSGSGLEKHSSQGPTQPMPSQGPSSVEEVTATVSSPTLHGAMPTENGSLRRTFHSSFSFHHRASTPPQVTTPPEIIMPDLTNVSYEELMARVKELIAEVQAMRSAPGNQGMLVLSSLSRGMG